jgi:hypothetical protein
MGRREQARAEADFLRGDTGVDGQATEQEQRDEAEVEKDQAREQLLRGRTYLGREFLTWLLWRSEAAEPLAQVEGQPLSVQFNGRLMLRGVVGDVTEMMVRGSMAPYAEQVRHALDKGLLVHSARLRLTHGERAFEVTLDAEYLDLRSAKLPELMSEEQDDQVTERLYLAEQLSDLVDALVQAFLTVRSGRTWSRQVVPALKKWMQSPDI